MALITQSDLEARLQRSLTNAEQSAFPVVNSAIQTYVEGMIGSSVEEVEASTRYYDGGIQYLAIDPSTDISAVTYVDDESHVKSTFLTSEYIGAPANRTLKTSLRRRYGRFNSGFGNIAITAKFSIYGDEKMRNVVKDAILQALVSEIQNTGNTVKESIEGYSVEYATTEAKSALNSIKFFFPGVM